MRLVHIIFSVMFLVHNVCAQDSRINRSTIAFESGIFSRGIIGLSYNCNFLKNQRTFLSVDLNIGVGSSWSSFNYYSGIGTTAYIGNQANYFTLGIEGKLCDIGYGQKGGFILPDEIDRYRGLTVVPRIGYAFFGHNNFVFKFQAGAVPIFEDTRIKTVLPSIGVSFGVGIGNGFREE